MIKHTAAAISSKGLKCKHGTLRARLLLPIPFPSLQTIGGEGEGERDVFKPIDIVYLTYAGADRKEEHHEKLGTVRTPYLAPFVPFTYSNYSPDSLTELQFVVN